MKFFSQNDDISCQYVALQTVLSHYNIFPDRRDIKRSLPRHSFGNIIPELGIYLESIGIKTFIISNLSKIRESDKLFLQKLNHYKSLGKFEDRLVKKSDFSQLPIIVNVDWYKIKDKENKSEGHYIVVNRENKIIWLYDGSNYKRKIKTSLLHIIKSSQDINKWHDNGMWLFCR